MASTKVSDIIIPEVINPYLIKRTAEKNAFISSGIATSDPSVNITKGGKTVSIPFFKEISADPELLSDSTALTVNNVSTDKDIAAIHAQGIAFGSNDLARLFAGADPMQAIAENLSDVWAKKQQKVLLATLKGAMGATGMADSVNDQSTNTLDADIMADSMFLLGDSYANVTAIAMHSRVLAKLKKLDLVDLVIPSTLTTSYYTYMEKRVIVDDGLAPDAGVYPIYIFGNGAVSYNENSELATLESDRDILTGDTVVASRRVYTMHPRGIRWIGTPAGHTPSETELATSTNWELVVNRKDVSIAKILAKV